MNILSFRFVANETANGTVTAAEYSRRYAEARREASRLSASARAKIAGIYRAAAEEAASVVRASIERGLSELTVERWESIRSQLLSAAEDIANGVEREGRSLIERSSSLFPEIDAEYVLSAASAAGAGKLITRADMELMVSAVSRSVIDSLASRLWSDGYTFSERCWDLRDDWLERIKMTIAAGIAQGRDPVKIAIDIQRYTADGKPALAQRWGKLLRGTGEFSKRIPGRIDWRAARLVRSELYASLQDASSMAGDLNPGGNGLYDWVLSAGREAWPCECASLASGGPYRKDEIPTYPHPNCMCSVRPQLMDRDKFVSDLKRWASGADVDYLDSWYRDKYKAVA